MSLDSWHVACQLPFKEVNMLLSFKQKTSAAKVVEVYISKLNTEMIEIETAINVLVLRQQGRNRKISSCHTKGYACLMGEKILCFFKGIFAMGVHWKCLVKTSQKNTHNLCF